MSQANNEWQLYECDPYQQTQQKAKEVENLSNFATSTNTDENYSGKHLKILDQEYINTEDFDTNIAIETCKPSSNIEQSEMPYSMLEENNVNSLHKETVLNRENNINDELDINEPSLNPVFDEMNTENAKSLLDDDVMESNRSQTLLSNQVDDEKESPMDNQMSEIERDKKECPLDNQSKPTSSTAVNDKSHCFCKEELKKLQLTVDRVLKKSNDIILKCQKLYLKCSVVPNILKDSSDSDIQNTPVLPISNPNEFTAFVHLLHQDENYKTHMISKLSVLGGKNHYEIVKRMINSILDPNVARNMNLTGRNDKIKFGEKVIMEIILKAAEKHCNLESDTTYKIIEKCISKYFYNSRDRQSFRRKSRQEFSDPYSFPYTFSPFRYSN